MVIHPTHNQNKMIENKLYNGDIIINYYDTCHRYKLKGEKKYLLGVTTICNMLDKSGALLNWQEKLIRQYLTDNIGAVIDEKLIDEACNQRKNKIDTALTTGSSAHEWIENFIKGEISDIPKDEKLANAINAFLSWHNNNDIKFLKTEEIVYSKKHGYVGRYDSIIELNGERYLIDFKTSSNVYPEHRYQTSAYVMAHNEEFNDNIRKRLIIKLDKETGCFDVIELHDLEEDFECFLALLKLKLNSKI